MTKNQQLIYLRKFLKLNQEEFSARLGITQAHYSRVESGKNDLPFSVAATILKDYKVNPNWLFFQEGAMFLNKDEEKTIEKIESNAIEVLDFNYNLEDPLEEYMTISNNKFMDIGSGKMQMLIPLVEEYAYGGYLSGFQDIKYLNDLPKFSIIVEKHHKGNYMSFEVRGDSMNNDTNESICSGDIAVGRSISKNYWNSRFHLKTWKDFIIVHSGGIIIKRIIEHDVENGTIVCASLNPDKINYPNLTLNLEDVYELFNVIEVSRKRK